MKKIWNLMKTETKLKVSGWPAKDYVQSTGIDIQTLFHLRKIFKGKSMCDIGFGRGNILHAFFPYADSIVGYETKDAVSYHEYTSTEELIFLKSQNEKPARLIYDNFEDRDNSQVDNIDVFYCTIGIQKLESLRLDAIFDRNPQAVLIYSFFMEESELWDGKGARIPQGSKDHFLTALHHLCDKSPVICIKKEYTSPQPRIHGSDITFVKGHYFMSIFDPSNSIATSLLEEIKNDIAQNEWYELD